MKETQLLIGEASQSLIDDWKKKHPGGIYAIIVDDKDILYFKNPSRHDLNAAYSKQNPDAIYDIYEELAKITVIGGAMELLQEDQSFIGIADKIKSKLGGKKAELVNL